MKKAKIIIFIFAVLTSIPPIITYIGPLRRVSTIGVIGGPDGPTAFFITGGLTVFGLLSSTIILPATLFITWFILHIKTKKS